jgi:hypothetical protein
LPSPLAFSAVPCPTEDMAYLVISLDGLRVPIPGNRPRKNGVPALGDGRFQLRSLLRLYRDSDPERFRRLVGDKVVINSMQVDEIWRACGALGIQWSVAPPGPDAPPKQAAMDLPAAAGRDEPDLTALGAAVYNLIAAIRKTWGP